MSEWTVRFSVVHDSPVVHIDADTVYIVGRKSAYATYLPLYHALQFLDAREAFNLGMHGNVSVRLKRDEFIKLVTLTPPTDLA